MNRKEKFLKDWAWECEVTLKVLKALGADKSETRPDKVGRTARELGWTLALEQITFGKTAKGQTDMNEFGAALPQNWNDVVTAFENNHNESKKIISELSEQNFENKIIKLPWREASIEDALMTFLHDMIHHRGQFSVYLRLAGHKVPAIYGPSADFES